MEPIPETQEAVDEYGPFSDHDLIADLLASGRAVRALVPDCVGLSLSIFQHAVTLTLVATRAEKASMDAAKAPADVAATSGHRTGATLDESRWGAFARETAADGVASTLTLPIFTAGQVTGSISLYAASLGAFTMHHIALAKIFGAWAAGAVTDADLDFSSRAEARAAPRLQREEVHIVRACGLLAGVLGIGISEARAQISSSADTSGITETMLAEFVISVLGEEPRGA